MSQALSNPPAASPAASSSEQKQAERFHAVELVYAQALLELAQSESKVDSVAAEVRQIKDLLFHNPDVIRLLASRVLSHEERDAAFHQAFKGKISDLLFRFLRVLIKRDRFDELPGIATAFLHLVDQTHGTIDVHAYVALPLTDQAQNSIITRIKELSGRDVRLSQHLDTSLIGGLKLRVGDEMIDGSVVTQLRLIEQKLMETSREAARNSLSRLVTE